VWLGAAILLAIFVVPGAWDMPVVLGGAAIEGAEALFWFRWSRKRRAAVGGEALVGKTAIVVERLDPVGRVKVDGELWRARANVSPVEVGAEVRVGGLDELTLVVEPE
jgi:membrane-bound serine protease (ClpP class)